MDADYVDNLALLANTPTQAKTLFHSLEQLASSNGLYVNSDETELMCLNQNCTTSH